MTYIVTVINKGETYYLRGTTWSAHLDRADFHQTREAAAAAAKTAEKFMAPKIRKTYQIHDAPKEQ
jgi:hypothetical protein